MENQIPKTFTEAMNPKNIRDPKVMKISGLKGKAPVIREPKVTRDNRGMPHIDLGW